MSWSIIAVGTGSAFNTKDFQTNFLLEAPSGKRLLVDLGTYGPIALERFGVHGGNVGQMIDGVYVSHLHADHIGGLEWLAFCTYFHPDKIKPKLYCVSGLMQQLWQKSLRGGLGSVQGKTNTLMDYFEGHPLKVNEVVYWEGLELQPVQTVHIMNGMEIVPSYGLLVREVNDRRHWPYDVFITTDTQFCPKQIQDFYDMAGLILHDCETAPYFSGVHAHYDDLKTLPEKTRKKMLLCHYQPNPSQEPVPDGFRGFLKRGHRLTFEDAALKDLTEKDEKEFDDDDS